MLNLMDTTMRLLKNLITVVLFHVFFFLKWLISELSMDGMSQSGNDFCMIIYNCIICMDNKNHIDDSLKLFLSGHLTDTFMGLNHLLHINLQ